MDIGATKMETPRQFLQENHTQSAGGSASTSANTCSNLPPDDARPVALETTPNPLAYWPPPSSGLPLITSSKDTADDPQSQISNINRSHSADSVKSSGGDRNVEESSAGAKCNEASQSPDESSSVSQPTKILHHNLPPIAGITSSHNYRAGAREAQKYPNVNAAESPKAVVKPTSETTGTEGKSTEGCEIEKDFSAQTKQTDDEKTTSDSDKNKEEQSGDCEILEVPRLSSSSERPRTSNPDHVFSIPTAINSTSSLKAMPSPRAPTPFVHATGPSPVPATSSTTETLTLNVNSSSSLPAGSPSPSTRTVPSPHFVAPSPTGSGNFQCPSPSNRAAPSPHFAAPSPTASGMPGNLQCPSPSTRAAPSPHIVARSPNAPSPHFAAPSPNASSPHFTAPSPTGSLTSGNLNCPSPSDNTRILPSPSNLQRVLSSSHLRMPSPNDGSRVQSSPHLTGFSPNNSLPPSSSPSQRVGMSSYVPNSHSNISYLNTPRNNYSDAPSPNHPADSSRMRMGHNSIESDRLLKDSTRQSQPNQNFPMGLPKTNLPLMNPTPASSVQRIEQSLENQICRNPFELPLSKSYSQQYSQTTHHQQQQQYQSQQQQHLPPQMTHFPNNTRNPSDPHPKIDHYSNLHQIPKEQHRTLGSNYQSPGFKVMSSRMNNEKEPERPFDAQYKHFVNSQPGQCNLPKPPYPMGQLQNDASMQRRTPNSLRNETFQRDYPKQPEITGSKPNGANLAGNNMWNKQETSEIGNKIAYLNAQNINKSFNKVNSNEYANRRIQETGYQNSVKPGIHVPDNIPGRYNVSNGEKSSAGFSSVNQMNSLSQRFPPVPQSNYDLNRQIYDTMTGGTRAVQPPVTKPLDKNASQFVKDQNSVNLQSCKTQPYYPDFPKQDKGKSYMQNIPVKQNDYSGQPRNLPPRSGQDYRSNSYAQYNNMVNKIPHDATQSRRPSVNQASVNQFQSQIQPSEIRHQQPLPMPDHLKPTAQGFPSRISTSHHMSQSPTQATDRSRSNYPTTSQPMFLPKHQQNLPEYDSKKMVEVKPEGNISQFSSAQNVQPVIHSGQAKNRPPSSAPTPVRSKRESPLDLSVKTVRQSADSTAKDDGDVYLHSFRNFLGPNQPLRSEPRYSVTQSNDGASGAPKIDFTPNFSGFHSETQYPVNPPQHHKLEVPVLPPVESFKKLPTRLPTPMVQDPKIRSGYTSPKYFSPPAMNNQKPQSLTADQTSVRYPQADPFKTEAQKRPANDATITHPFPPKIPKLDPWKLAFDQQIEQRLNSARISHQNSQNNVNNERTLNGIDASKSTAVGSQYPVNYQTSKHSNNNYRGANMYPRPPVQTSATPYNPSYVQQPQCQPATPQTPQQKLQHRENVGHSPDPEQIIKQISKGVMPDHKLLQDKNVLSILRSSLEEKEAKLMQLREAARRKEKYKETTAPDVHKKQFQPFEQTSKSQTQSKQSLPPFGALTLERMCAPPSFPGHKLNLPRSIDTVKIDIEPTQKYFSPAVKNEAEKSGIPNVDLSPQDDAQGPPTDLDGLAAFLAARIRTKGELKQVGPALEPGRPPLGQDMRMPIGTGAPLNETLSKGIASNHNFHPTNVLTSGSPPKLVRESRLLPPLRRRLFSHTEEDTPTTSGAHNDEQSRVPPRDPNGIRSSSETSVFDFRESDSDGEMPVLERQTLDGMRRDRKIFGSKQNVSITAQEEVIMDVDKPEVIKELDKSHPDPFWDTAFDMFVEQLEKRPPKRSVRKKKIFSRIPTAGSETEEIDRFEDNPDKEKTYPPYPDEGVETKVKETEKIPEIVEVKREPEEEKDKVETVHDGHVKLSSSRLKIYRDELLREDKLKEMKLEKEEEIPDKVACKEAEKETEKKKTKEAANQGKKNEEKEKKEEGGVKTRGRSKVGTKDMEIMEYETESEKELRSESESTAEDDDDSLSLSGLESESSDSDSSEESSNSNSSSYEDSETEQVAKKKMRMQTRLQTRSSKQRQVKGTGMRLRSKPIPLPKTTTKPTKKRRKKRKEEFFSSGKKKKPSFGDGSDFRPGWEEECYKFKQQLRMPEKLISISRPPKRPSASLPDLDPYRNSPSLDSSDVSLPKKSELAKSVPGSDDSDSDVKKQKSKGLADSDNTVGSLLKLRNGKKTQSTSIINLLVNKYGKGNFKKKKELKAMNERKSPRILPKATNKPELLPTPSLGIGKENVLKDKKRTKDGGKKKTEESDSVYLGYFRKKTVNNFKEAFKQKVGLLPEEFNPVVLKSRTRTQTRDMKKRATLMEVFGEERPASAPPLTVREEDTSTDQEKTERVPEKKKPKLVKKMCGGVVTRGRGKLMRSGRPGLRSTAVLRSNKAVQISKRHLNSGRKRNMELLRIRAMASKKFSYLVTSSEASSQLPITKKRLKLRSVRRKFRSGFDYIRKKKKMKKDGDSADGSVKERRLPSRPTSESVEDVQNEIKTWVINKGLGETILHRAARLGYTDIAAYCLEKMDCSPSPRDNAGYTPLHEACSRGHLDIAKLLLMYGASVSESAKGGIRPLHEAAENGYTELIRLLLSYGADPLLETYTGLTALSLVTDEEARRLIQHHLADVQGNVAPVWTFQGPSSLFDPPESGYDPLCDPPSPQSVHSDFELEVSDAMLPPLYRLAGDPDRYWVLMRDILSYTKAKSKDAVLKQLDPASVREMKLSEFNEQGKCLNFLGIGEKSLTKASKVVLVHYDEKLRQLLNVESFVV